MGLFSQDTPLMKDYDSSQEWKPEYERKGGHAIEAPMFAPDDLIGSGLISKDIGFNPLRPENKARANELVAGNQDKKQFKDYELHYVTDGEGQSNILAMKNGNTVGNMNFVEFDRKFHPDVFVAENDRRQGLASAMYDYAREMGWFPDAPHGTRTDAGHAFRNSYDTKRDIKFPR